MIGLQQRRAARNEAFFRDVNERAAAARESGPSFAHTEHQQRFVCECADDRCMETILVDVDVYRAVRADERRFILVAGHETAEIERVVARRDGYLIVEKHEDPGDG